MRDAPTAPATAFIWYHADARLEPDLLAWVAQTGRSLGLPARLMLRRQPQRTTFMEVYELPRGQEQEMLERIERMAAAQPWFGQIDSPRRAEVFTLSMEKQAVSD